MKLFSKGDSVFRTNMTAQRRTDTFTNTADVEGIKVVDQATQTVHKELRTVAVQVDPAATALAYLTHMAVVQPFQQQTVRVNVAAATVAAADHMYHDDDDDNMIISTDTKST